MFVRDLCSTPPRTCAPDSTLAAAGGAMWDADCGFLPVVDGEGKVLGVITDRDIAIATATRGEPAHRIAVRDVISGKVQSCRPDHEIREALKILRRERVRRLAVIDAENRLVGVLSIDDIARVAVPDRKARPVDVTFEDLALAMKSVCVRAPRLGEPAKPESRALAVTGAP